MKPLNRLILTILILLAVNCGPYSFNGLTDIPKTFQVNFFQNNAPLNEPGIDILFTNTLQDLILNQTNSQLVKSNGEVIFEGEITQYRVEPMTATANNTAAQNRLTIAVNVRYINTKNEDKDFERSFSFFFDFPDTTQLTSIKDEAHEVVFDRITQDILNASLADW